MTPDGFGGGNPDMDVSNLPDPMPGILGALGELMAQHTAEVDRLHRMGWRTYPLMWVVAVLQAERVKRRPRALTQAAIARRLGWDFNTVGSLIAVASRFGLARRTRGHKWRAGWDPVATAATYRRWAEGGER